MSVRNVHVSAREAPFEIEVNGVVVAIAIVVGVSDRPKTGVQPSRGDAVVNDQIVRQNIDIHSVGDIADRVAVADNIVGVRSVITHGCGKVAAYLSFHACRPDICLRRFQQRINPADRETGTHNSALCIKPALESRKCETKGRFAAGSQHKDRGSRRSREKGRQDQTWRTASEFFLDVRRRQPVVVHAKTTAYYPVALSRRIPSDSNTRTEQVIDRVQQSIMRRFRVAVRYLLLLGVARTEVEISEHGRCTLGPRVATVVISQAQSKGEISSRLPCVFNKQPEGSGSRVPIPQLLVPGCRVVHDAVFVCRSILRQGQQIVEREFRLRPRTLEGFDVIPVPAFITELQSVRASYMREDIAPVIVVLNEVALREADTVGLSGICVDPVYQYGRHGIVFRATSQNAFHSAQAGGEII